VVDGGVDLLGNRAALRLGLRNCRIQQRRILGLLRRRENQGGVGGGILGLVLANGCDGVSKSSRDRGESDAKGARG
jgi:hypothetical protein